MPMTPGEAPTFPVLLQCIPQPKWQRSLIPIENTNFDDVPGDPPGWVANDGYRIIDRDRRAFSAEFDGAAYSFSGNGTVTDEELRELMIQNFGALGKSGQQYIERAKSLHGQELFDYTFQTALTLPDMSAAMRAGGCTLIALLCLLAAAIPGWIHLVAVVVRPDNQPMQRTGAAGKLLVIRRLLERGSGR